jgi:adenylate cyclase
VASERVKRRLTAILAADVACYSRLMGADEVATLAQLTASRATMDRIIAAHCGRVVNSVGDSVLAEFASVVDAVEASVAIQRETESADDRTSENCVRFRIGLHVGEVMIRDTDIYGDGVNVAARLQTLAEPGGICVSSRVQEDTQGKLDIVFEDMGEQQLKNIVRPVRAYRVWMEQKAAKAPQVLALPDKPSIAVLPFQNMSGDPEQEYFADGIAEDIITTLSRRRWLFVISRNSSFVYTGAGRRGGGRSRRTGRAA